MISFAWLFQPVAHTMSKVSLRRRKRAALAEDVVAVNRQQDPSTSSSRSGRVRCAHTKPLNHGPRRASSRRQEFRSTRRNRCQGRWSDLSVLNDGLVELEAGQSATRRPDGSGPSALIGTQTTPLCSADTTMPFPT